MLEQNQILSPKNQKGFTILEMTTVVIISGMLLAFLGAALLSFIEKSKIQTTQYRMEKISEAVSYYLTVNGHYPCPASRTLGSQNANFGKAVTANCTNTGVTNGTVINGGANGVRIGAVPTRTINVPDEYMSDGWGNKFTFAMSMRQATNLLYRADGGRVIIRDENNNNISTDFHYAIVSHGVSGNGAFPSFRITGGNPPIPCSTTAPISRDAENCDNDRVFRRMLVNNEANYTAFYDDYLYYKGIDKTEPIPAGAVTPFKLNACPDGWTDIFKTEGKFIIGVDETPPAILIYRLFMESTTRNINLNVGRLSPIDPITGQVTDTQIEDVNLPPYLSMKYCEKLPR